MVGRTLAAPASVRTVTLGAALEERYAAVVAPVVSAIERSLSTSVRANRVARVELDPPRIVLRRWRLERRCFRERLARLGAEHPVLLATDVRRCYPSIRASAVARVVDVLAAGTRGDAIASFLEELGSRGITGLPIGPAPSAVLANAVLGTVDHALQLASVPHLRWVDDLVIAIGRPGDADGVLQVIDAALRTVGLRRNEGKTLVLCRGERRPGMIVPSMFPR